VRRSGFEGKEDAGENLVFLRVVRPWIIPHIGGGRARNFCMAQLPHMM
jgi:hypothetical protein